MLAGKQRGRHHHRHLFAAHCGHERRAQRHFGFAEADIADDQPVHRAAGGEILEHVADRAVLVVGLLIREAVDKGGIAAGIRLGDFGGAGGALGGGGDELARDLADALLHLGLAQLPARAAKAIQLRRAFIGAIARQQFDILDRQEQLAAIIL